MRFAYHPMLVDDGVIFAHTVFWHTFFFRFRTFFEGHVLWFFVIFVRCWIDSSIKQVFVRHITNYLGWLFAEMPVMLQKRTVPIVRNFKSLILLIKPVIWLLRDFASSVLFSQRFLHLFSRNFSCGIVFLIYFRCVSSIKFTFFWYRDATSILFVNIKLSIAGCSGTTCSAVVLVDGWLA